MYLAVSAETSEENIIQKVPQLVKVCSATHIEHLVGKPCQEFHFGISPIRPARSR